MQIQTTLIIERLNHLTAILNDASEGFLTVSLHARNKEWENFFEKLSYQRKDFAREIKKIVHSLGAPSYSEGGFLSLLHRTWKDMSFQLKSRDRDAVKTCCVIGEKFTCNYYESILNDPELPEPVKTVLAKQHASVKATLKQFERAQKKEAATEMETAPDAALPHESTAVSESAAQKICFLIAYLERVSKDFEGIADEIGEANLQNAFIALAEENKQFAEELQCELKQQGIIQGSDDELGFYHLQAEEDQYETENKPGVKNELMHICERSEYLFLKLYTDALKEFLGVKNLKDLMIYQYNSIRAGFFKLRLLNSLRFNNEFAHV